MTLTILKKHLSLNIKARRAELGISQEKLAFSAGIDRTYQSLIERNLANPSLEVLFKLAVALETTPDKLLKPIK